MSKSTMTVDVLNNKVWTTDKGRKHREDGPAVIQSGGTKFWYINGKRHRIDGPAIEFSNGDKSWWVNGMMHREDGPALDWKSLKEYWLEDVRYTKEQFYKKMRLKKIKSLRDNPHKKKPQPTSYLKNLFK